MDRINRVYGVDFSGSRDAGRGIWVAAASLDRDQRPDGNRPFGWNRLVIEDCYRGEDLPGSARGRDQCLRSLRDFIRSAGASAIGLDFPFGLPEAMMGGMDWRPWLLDLAARHGSPEALREECGQRSGGREWKRVAETEARCPFSPYNLRMYRQTFYGLCHVLAPLVADNAVCALPMQSTEPGKPSLLEICPASTLKRLNLYKSPYKGRSLAHESARAAILTQLEARTGLVVNGAALRSALVGDPGGDALDSVVAAVAVARAMLGPARPPAVLNPVYRVEGFVYV